MSINLKNILTKFKSIFLIPMSIILILYVTHSYSNEWLSILGVSKSFRSGFLAYEPYLYLISLSLVSYWLAVGAINSVQMIIKKSNQEILQILCPLFVTVAKIIVFLMIFNQLIHQLHLPHALLGVLSKITSSLIIVSISFTLLKIINVAGLLLLHYQASKDSAALSVRKIKTQTQLLQRVASGIVVLISAGCVLMLFDNVKALGASVLTTAGIAGLVLTFTAQRSLGSIFAGLEIALTQPIKIGDSVLVENEFGTIEEINFRSVVIKLWDLRRLVVPTNYFLEKPFQNWSRQQDISLIGSIFLFVDFTLPVSKLRIKLNELLEASSLWDGKVAKVQVHDLKEHTMQIRILVSACSPDDVSSLKADIREKIINYISTHYPESLPLARQFSLEQSKNKMESISAD